VIRKKETARREDFDREHRDNLKCWAQAFEANLRAIKDYDEKLFEKVRPTGKEDFERANKRKELSGYVKKLEQEYSKHVDKWEEELRKRCSFDTGKNGPVDSEKACIDIEEYKSKIHDYKDFSGALPYRIKESIRREGVDAAYVKFYQCLRDHLEKNLQAIAKYHREDKGESTDAFNQLTDMKRKLTDMAHKVREKWNEELNDRYKFDTGNYGPANEKKQYIVPGGGGYASNPPGYPDVENLLHRREENRSDNRPSYTAGW